MNRLRLILAVLLLVSWATAGGASAQSRIDNIVDAEAQAGHFNGALLAAKDGKLVSRLSRGQANFQFAVPIAAGTRLPIASMTKLFTAILLLQLYEKALVKLDDRVSRYVTGLPVNCQDLTILDLLTHRSGLQNEPVQAYATPLSTADFIKQFVVKKTASPAAFNYNNVDYILLTRVLEVAAKRPYPVLLQEQILQPLGMANSGVVSEARIISGLAYGYHNYSYGSGKKEVPLNNDPPIYLSNYAGAGAMYSTPDDLYKLVLALRDNRLLSAKTTELLKKPQQLGFVVYARGRPTLGFYVNDKTFARPVLERRGSINGFNSVLLTDEEFNKVVILLANTDTGDLELMGDKIYTALE